MESKKEFQNWFESKYCAKIDFNGDSIKTPMMDGRSQGKSVALCANVGCSAWQEASKRSEILIAQSDLTVKEITSGGMVLRDYFAAKAMQAICSHNDTWGFGNYGSIAGESYNIADAMLKAREVKS